MKTFGGGLLDAPAPGCIDWDWYGGPALYYEGIGAAQVTALELLLPSDDSYTPVANLVVFGDGTFDLFAAFRVSARADLGFAEFLRRALARLDDAEVRE